MARKSTNVSLSSVLSDVQPEEFVSDPQSIVRVCGKTPTTRKRGHEKEYSSYETSVLYLPESDPVEIVEQTKAALTENLGKLKDPDGYEVQVYILSSKLSGSVTEKSGGSSKGKIKIDSDKVKLLKALGIDLADLIAS